MNHSFSKSFSHRGIVIILVTVFTLLQILVLLIFGYSPSVDSDSYIAIATECVSYGEPYPIKELINEMPFLWNIGAINAVVASLALTGTVKPLLVLYSLMKGMTIALTYLVAKKLFGHKTAMACLLLSVLYPANYGESTTTLSELPFMFFIMLGMWLSFVHSRYFLGGMSFAFANWFRPMGFVFLLALILFVIYKYRKAPAVFLLKRIGILVSGFVLMICLIGFSSMHRTGLFLFQAKTGWMNLADFCTNNSPETLAVRDNDNWNVSQKDSAWNSIFMDWLEKHPGKYVSQMPRKVAETFVSDNVNMCVYTPDKMYDSVSLRTLIKQFPSFSPVQWLALLNLLFYYLLLLTALGSLLYFNLERHLLPISCIVIGTFVLMLVGFHGDARFHQPFMPFIIMLSSFYLTSRTRKRGNSTTAS